jgi:uncharacterized protein (TIGR02246 family)
MGHNQPAMKKLRQTHLILFIGVALFTIAPCFPIQSQKILCAGVPGPHDEDLKILASQPSDYEKAFAAGNAKALADMWTNDGTYTDVDGRIIKGREALKNYFKNNFEQYGVQPLKITIESIKFLSNDVAIEEGHSRLLNGPNMDVLSRYFVVHQKVNDVWLMSNVIETVYPEASEGSLQDWEWLVGNWMAKPTPEKSMHIQASWATGHKFIRCLFIRENSGSNAQFAMVVIGRDPSTGQIVSWHFDPSGGFGSGSWIKDGQTWIERATSTEADGTKGSAIYVLHKLDENTFTWRSTQRSLGDVNLPDSEEVTIAREQATGL